MPRLFFACLAGLLVFSLHFNCLLAQKTANAVLFPIEVNEKWGYIDSTGKVVIAPRFVRAFPFSENRAFVLDTMAGFSWSKQTFTMKDAYSLHDALLFGFNVSITGKQWQVIDPTGKVLFEPQYSGVRGFFLNGYAPVQYNFNQKWTFINRDGKESFKPAVDKLDFVRGNLAACGIGRSFAKEGFITPDSGMIRIPIIYDDVEYFSEGLAPIKGDSGWFFVDEKGKPAPGLSGFKQAEPFSEGVAIVMRDSVYLIIDKTGKTLAALPAYDNVDNFSEGLSRVLYNAKYEEGGGFFAAKIAGDYGFVDKKGKLVIDKAMAVTPPKPGEDMFSAILGAKFYGFRDGRALVKREEKYGYIDKTGKTVVAVQFDDAFAFSNGLALVKTGEKWAYINRAGKVVWRQI